MIKHIKVGDAKDLLEALDDRPQDRVFNPDKKYTRAQAERALSAGMDPEPFTKHANYHVRRKAWTLMGKPLPEGLEEQNKFLVTLQGTTPPTDKSALEGWYVLLRQRILKEVPVKEEAPPVQEESASPPVES